MLLQLKQVLIAIDRRINALLDGNPNETLSSRAYRMEQAGKPMGFMRRVIDTLFWFDKDHCKESYQNELKRAHVPHIEQND